MGNFNLRNAVERNARLLKDIKCALSPDASDDILQQILDVLTEINEKPEIESLDPIPFCEDGAIVGYTAYQRDEESGDILTVYFDATGAVTTTAPTGEPCAAKPDVEFKFFEKEKCLADGSKVTEVLCQIYEDKELDSESTFWIVNGVSTTTDPGTIDCVDCEGPGSQGTLTSWDQIRS